MEVLQFAVAEVPLEPCSRPWPYFWPTQLYAACWSGYLLASHKMEILRLSLAAGSGHISGLPSTLLYTFQSLLVLITVDI